MRCRDELDVSQQDHAHISPAFHVSPSSSSSSSTSDYIDDDVEHTVCLTRRHDFLRVLLGVVKRQHHVPHAGQSRVPGRARKTHRFGRTYVSVSVELHVQDTYCGGSSSPVLTEQPNYLSLEDKNCAEGESVSVMMTD